MTKKTALFQFQHMPLKTSVHGPGTKQIRHFAKVPFGFSWLMLPYNVLKNVLEPAL